MQEVGDLERACTCNMVVWGKHCQAAHYSKQFRSVWVYATACMCCRLARYHQTHNPDPKLFVSYVITCGFPYASGRVSANTINTLFRKEDILFPPTWRIEVFRRIVPRDVVAAEEIQVETLRLPGFFNRLWAHLSSQHLPKCFQMRPKGTKEGFLRKKGLLKFCQET